MFEQPKIALGLTLFLATACPAAGHPERTDTDTYGGATQTWQDIERSREEVQQRIQREYHPGAAANGAALNEKPRRRSHHIR